MKEKRSPSKNSYSSIKKINFMNSTKTIDWIDNDIYLYLYIQNFIKKFKKILMLYYLIYIFMNKFLKFFV